MTIISLGFITGVMVGIEFPGAEGVMCVIDLGIIRIVFTKEEVEE